MANPVLLNNIDHKNLHVIRAHCAEYGDAVMSALTFPGEFRDIQSCYPIVFRSSADAAGFEPLALFGFQEGENLFLSRAGWDASYIPLMVERQPFLIGRSGEELLVHVDLASPRLSETLGEPVFLPHGGNTDYLEQVNSTLFTIHQGLQATLPFISALKEHQLLESFVLDIELDDGAQGRLAGFFTINEDRLAALDSEVIARLHRAGYLQAIYMVIASLSNLRLLIARKNAHAR